MSLALCYSPKTYYPISSTNQLTKVGSIVFFLKKSFGTEVSHSYLMAECACLNP